MGSGFLVSLVFKSMEMENCPHLVLQYIFTVLCNTGITPPKRPLDAHFIQEKRWQVLTGQQGFMGK